MNYGTEYLNKPQVLQLLSQKYLSNNVGSSATYHQHKSRGVKTVHRSSIIQQKKLNSRELK